MREGWGVEGRWVGEGWGAMGGGWVMVSEERGREFIIANPPLCTPMVLILMSLS